MVKTPASIQEWLDGVTVSGVPLDEKMVSKYRKRSLDASWRERFQIPDLTGTPWFYELVAASKEPVRSLQPVGSKPQPNSVQPTATAPKPANKPKQKKPAGLGDAVESALKMVGITEERVSAWIGAPCGCSARKKRLNDLGAWAARVLLGERSEPPLE